jgi:hypothetical protein
MKVAHSPVRPGLYASAAPSLLAEYGGDLAWRIRWPVEEGAELVLTANLKAAASAGINPPPGRVLWQEGSAVNGGLGPWNIVWPLFGGAS